MRITRGTQIHTLTSDPKHRTLWRRITYSNGTFEFTENFKLGQIICCSTRLEVRRICGEIKKATGREVHIVNWKVDKVCVEMTNSSRDDEIVSK